MCAKRVKGGGWAKWLALSSAAKLSKSALGWKEQLKHSSYARGVRGRTALVAGS